MQSALQTHFNALEARKSGLVRDLATWETGRLRYQPSPSAWCALHVLDHVVKTEAAILDAMRRPLFRPRPVPAPDRVKGLLLTLLFLTPARVKAPATVKSILPGNTPDLAALIRAWTHTRMDLGEFLEFYPPRQLAFAIFRHPVAGWMTLPRTLSFLNSHIVHHRYQLKRLGRAGSAA